MASSTLVPVARAPRIGRVFVASLVPTVTAPTLVVYILTVALALSSPGEAADRAMSHGERLTSSFGLTLVLAPLVYLASFGVSVALTLLFTFTLHRAAITRKSLYLLVAAAFAVVVHVGIFVALALPMAPIPQAVPALIVIAYAAAIGLATGALLWPAHRATLAPELARPTAGA